MRHNSTLAHRTRTGTELDDEQRLSWLRLIRSENVGAIAFRQLINRFGTATAALDAIPEIASRGRRTIRICSEERAEREMDHARSLGCRFVALGEPQYPAALAALEAPPPMLAVRGDPSTLVRASIGIVGSRNSSMVGMKMCERLAAAFGRADYTVVSGLARGIDAVAHRASLATGTVACMAGGLDRPYPAENVPLMNEIAENGGTLISEMPFGLAPRARDFPRRNRLIAGLSLGVVVVEAAARSGSLITARLANEAGRLVFAVPGNPLDPRAAGTNGLLKQGAILATDAADVLDAVAPLEEAAVPMTLFDADDQTEMDEEPAETDRERIIEALGPTPVPVDDLQAHTHVNSGTMQMVLLELDLAGRLERHEGNQVSLIPEERR